MNNGKAVIKPRKFIFVLLAILAVAWASPLSLISQERRHRMSDAEKDRMPFYLEQHKFRASAPPPPAPVRGIAEFEQMEGVLIAYPLGIPVQLVKEMSEDVMVTTIVTDASKESAARSLYTSNGVNMAKCNFIRTAYDSYWTRDYGPWFVINGAGKVGVVDFVYNRPRPNDDAIPDIVANFLGLDSYDMDLVQCGGNYMTDGLGIAVSTDLVWSENSSKSQTAIRQIMTDYNGIQTYHVTTDPLGDYIKHVDCWGKYLAVDKIIITKVPTSSSNYTAYENMATWFSNQTTGYGNKYRVYRVTSTAGQPYTNSLILNNKVLLPTTGSTGDSGALTSYQQAMPGYEVLGFTSSSWVTTDALHCRVIGIADRGLLYIKHTPLLGQKSEQTDYPVYATIIPYSGQALVTASIKLFYRVNGGAYQSIVMTQQTADTFSASIPHQAVGASVGYYIQAGDASGRTSRHPYIGSPDPHVFTVSGNTNNPPVAQFVADKTTVVAGGTVVFTDQTIYNPTSWSWTFTGGAPASSTQQNPAVVYNTVGTYTVSLTASNPYGSDGETKTGYITVTSPGLNYCASASTNASSEWISNVTVGALNKTSTSSKYSDFTSLSVNVTRGASVSCSVTPAFSGSSYTEYFRIWIDYNKDGDFADSGEQVFSKSGKAKVSGTFTVPSTAKTGATRMRVSMKYSAYPTYCETFNYGEVEDYTVNIQ